MFKTLAVVARDGFNSSRPWKVIIYGDKDLGIRGGVEGPWKTRKKALAWASEFNRIHNQGAKA